MKALDEPTRLTVIIVTHNSCGFIRPCLESVLSRTDNNRQIIVVDNGSADDTIKVIEEEFPEVELHPAGRNLGFAQACNIGLAQATGEYLLFLNPDAKLLNFSIDRVIDYFRANPMTALLGGQLLNPDGSVQVSCAGFFHLGNILLDRLLIRRFAPPRLKARLLAQYSDHRRLREVDWFLGAFMVARRQTVDDLNGFDESFFLYGEDMDLCYRARASGWRNVFFPEIKAVHWGPGEWNLQKMKLVNQSLYNFNRKFTPVGCAGVVKLLCSTRLGLHHIKRRMASPFKLSEREP